MEAVIIKLTNQVSLPDHPVGQVADLSLIINKICSIHNKVDKW